MIKLYTTECPRCNVLEKKLNEKNITYEKIKDFDASEMINKGFVMMPILCVDDKYYEYREAVEWLNDN